VKIIGIGGKAGSGKGYIGRMLRDRARRSGKIAAPWAFAWPLKMRTAMTYGFSVADILQKPEHVRTALQQEGTEKGRDLYGEEFWVGQLKVGLALLQDEEPELKLVTVTDARFPNEIAAIKELGGVTIWVNSDRGSLAGQQAQHRSETSVSAEDFDYVLNNNRTVDPDDLEAEVAEIWWNTLYPAHS
jgi:hypothetical protein